MTYFFSPVSVTTKCCYVAVHQERLGNSHKGAIMLRMPCCVTSWGFLEGLLAFLCLAQQSGLSPPLNYYTWLTNHGLSVTFKSTLPLSMQFPFWDAILCGLILNSVPHMKMYPLVARFQSQSSYVGDVSMNQAL